MSKRDATVYLEAARIVADDSMHTRCCCPAIQFTTGWNKTGEAFVKRFSIFKPPRASYGWWWFGHPGEPDNREQRILALCFAAAMAEAGDL